MLDNPFSEDVFPTIQSKPPLVQLKAISVNILRLYRLQPGSLVMHQASLSGVSDQANFACCNNHLINPCLSKS